MQRLHTTHHSRSAMCRSPHLPPLPLPHQPAPPPALAACPQSVWTCPSPPAQRVRTGSCQAPPASYRAGQIAAVGVKLRHRGDRVARQSCEADATSTSIEHLISTPTEQPARVAGILHNAVVHTTASMLVCRPHTAAVVCPACLLHGVQLRGPWPHVKCCAVLCPTLTSSGKCQLYHSLTRMMNVLMSLSNVSSSAMAWITMLSTLFTLNFTLARL